MTEAQRKASSRIREWRHDPIKFVRDCFHAEPDAWQLDVLEMMARPGRKRIAMKACAGPGKGHPLSTRLHTPDGEVSWGSIRPGSRVFAVDGSICTVVRIFPLGLQRIYRVSFSDGSHCDVTGEHLWRVGGQRVVRSMRKRMDADQCVTINTLEIAEWLSRQDALSTRMQFSIPVQGAAQFSERQLPIHPYVLGVWIADGSRNSGRYSDDDEDVRRRLEYCGANVLPSKCITRTIGGVVGELRTLGLVGCHSYERFIPAQYQLGSVDQRKELLFGLMDTDGCVDADDGHCEYGTTSKRLANDVMLLVRSLGGKAKLKASHRAKSYRNGDGDKVVCREFYRVTVTTPFCPFTQQKNASRWHAPDNRYLTRYIESVTYVRDEDAMCIQVDHPSHCYLANDYIVTHNTAVLAWAGWHRLACFAAPNEHPKGAAVSITSDNLRDNLWAELARWQNESPFLLHAFEWQKQRIIAKDHSETWFLAAKGWSKSSDLETIGRTLSGQHARFPFYLIDESGDIPPNMLKSAEQGLTSCEDGLIITAGNTTSQTGMLYEVTTRSREQWEVISITADPDDPKRTPRVDMEWARQQIAKYGRENPWVMAYILGQFPPGSINALLSVEEVEAAMNRHVKPDAYEWAQKRLGIDVARFGDDRTVIFPRQGIVAFPPDVMRHARDSAVSVNIASRVMVKKQEWHSEMEFFDDSVGWAHGAIDVMRAAGHSPHPVNYGAPSPDPRYFNIRSFMWMKMADWIKAGGCLPNIPELVGELTQPTYFFQDGKMRIEEKDQIKKRLGKSPDLADALAETFVVPDAPGGMHDRLRTMGRQQSKPLEYDPYKNI